MDIADRAQATVDKLHEDALARTVRAARGIPPAPGTPSIYCVDCDHEIPEARRRAKPGCTRCIECQADVEGGR
jgi:phage/conjugal plasmid C-4 type zinc finger TraR family protein